jgi:ferritin-like metal-binding protein YciE
MSERFTNQEDVFRWGLGSALTMERNSLTMIGDLERAASRSDLKQLLRSNRDEAQEQLENLEKSFALMGMGVSAEPSPVMEGLAAQSRDAIAQSDGRIVDEVVIAEALQSGHYEVGVYERLVSSARARGAGDVATLLDRNLSTARSSRQKVVAYAAALESERTTVGTAEH